LNSLILSIFSQYHSLVERESTVQELEHTARQVAAVIDARVMAAFQVEVEILKHVGHAVYGRLHLLSHVVVVE